MMEQLFEPDEALVLSLAGGASVTRMTPVLREFGSLEAILGLPDRVLLQTKGIGPETLKSIRKTRDVDLDAERRSMERAKVTPLIFGQAGYPDMIYQEVHNPPLVLYVRGDVDLFGEPGVAVVGTRTPSHTGTKMAGRLGEELGGFPFVVYSGLATGVDGLAHEACLAGGGRTVAVLAHGLHTVQPPGHRGLARSIVAKGGAVVSEYPLGEPARKYTYIPRNRIIAALSLATVVVEGGVKSGARHTADFAHDYGRVLLAVPGRPDDPMAALPNRLIREKRAELCRGLEDILASLPLYKVEGVRKALDERAEVLARKARKTLLSLGPDASTILVRIGEPGNDPLHVDDICRLTGLDAPRVLALLLQMEIEGLVDQLPGMRYMANYIP